MWGQKAYKGMGLKMEGAGADIGGEGEGTGGRRWTDHHALLKTMTMNLCLTAQAHKDIRELG